VLVSAAAFAFLHFMVLFGRIGDATEATDGSGADSQPLDTAMRLTTNSVALLGNVAGLLGAQQLSVGGGGAAEPSSAGLAFKVYIGYLVANCVFTLGCENPSQQRSVTTRSDTDHCCHQTTCGR